MHETVDRHAASGLTQEAIVNIDEYRQRLQEEERAVLAQLERAGASAQELSEEEPRDAGDESVADVLKEDEFLEAEGDWTRLRQVREALQRIDDGTFGRCAVDGGPIEEKRLEAMPWTPYCLKHQQSLEGPEAARRITM
jgi:DnaK suppressor protein